MSYLYSRILASIPLTEEQENLGVKPDYSIKRIKLSLDGIIAINESEHTTGEIGVNIEYDNGDCYFIIDDFDRICTLHEEHIKESEYATIRPN